MSTDVSEPALAVLRRVARGEVLPADVTALPFAGGSFDAVVAGEVLEHVRDDRAALVEVARVLRPAGVLALSVPAHPAWFGASDRWAGHVRRYSRGGLERSIKGAGLALERVVPWGFPVSALYHRALYDKRASVLAADPRPRPLALGVLRLALNVDRLFVGVERGCLGYLAVARAAS